MTVCYFGDYNPAYARNHILIKGLVQNGVKIIECNDQSRGFGKYIRLIRQFRKKKYGCDYILVGYSDSRFSVPLLRLLTLRPVVWDPFYSLYDSWVHDKKLVPSWHPKAAYYWFLDWLNCKLAYKILLDTEQHKIYFIQKFSIPATKCIKVLIGSDDEFFTPQTRLRNADTFRVGFIGKYIPLQGVDTIIRAAHKLSDEKNIQFQLIGSGQTYSTVRDLSRNLKVKNVHFKGAITLKEVPKHIAEFDVVLGIFGTTGKTGRVIPNKVYEAIAMKKPIITGNTPAIRELFTDGEHMLLCKTGSAEDLAEKIIVLYKDSELRKKIAAKAYNLYKSKCTPKVVTEPLALLLSNLRKL